MSGTRAWVVIKTRDDSYSPVYAFLTEEIPPSRGKCSWMMNKNLRILYINHRYLYSIFKIFNCVFSSVQSSHSVMSDYLQPHKSQHARPPCPGVYSNSCPSSQWCHPAISSSVVPFSSCPQSLPASGVFSNESTLCMRWPKYWSFSFSTSPSNEHPGLISFRMGVYTHIYRHTHTYTHTRMCAWLYSLYSFSIVAVTNHHKLSSLR